MFEYIRGSLVCKGENYIVVDTNGIGYKINSSLYTIEGLGEIGEEVKIFTHLYVREDIMSLYGFSSHEEITMFELLISVSGVGPKAAISMMSAVSSSKFSIAIITEDTKILTQAQGIGKKIAQRIILELKDKIKKEQISIENFKNDEIDSNIGGNSKLSEAISALIVLGYTQLEANKAVSKVYTEDMELEEIIKLALKNLIK